MRYALAMRAFTLIELLVVITIIVVLLALLTPALDRAIYQAELTLCGANHRATVNGVVVYAMDHQRHYPFRANAQPAAGQAHNISKGAARGPQDDRPMLSTFIKVNEALQCPLSEKVDLETGTGESDVQSNYLLKFGWQFGGQKGMKRLGDRWEWNDANSGSQVRTGLLTTPMNTLGVGAWMFAGHPDSDGVLQQVVEQDTPYGNSAEVAGQNIGNSRTSSYYFARVVERGTLDLNFGFDSGTVIRIDGVRSQDPRLDPVPVRADGVAFNVQQTWLLASP